MLDTCIYYFFRAVGFFGFLFFFAVLGLELRAFTSSHSTSPVFVKGVLR
jgi:hypothetical protein